MQTPSQRVLKHQTGNMLPNMSAKDVGCFSETEAGTPQPQDKTNKTPGVAFVPVYDVQYFFILIKGTHITLTVTNVKIFNTTPEESCNSVLKAPCNPIFLSLGLLKVVRKGSKSKIPGRGVFHYWFEQGNDLVRDGGRTECSRGPSLPDGEDGLSP